MASMVFVLQELAHVDVGFGFGRFHFLDVTDAALSTFFVDIAERNDFRAGAPRRETFDVIGAAASDSSYGYGAQSDVAGPGFFA